jgi:AraC-like DNA-binding protein
MQNRRLVSQFAIDAVHTIKDYIEKHPLERITIPDLTDKTVVGKNLLHKAFRQIEGKTIIRFQLEIRMQEACNMLEEGRMTIFQIAYKCGYRDQANFSKDFKKVYKVAPKRFNSTIS